MRILPADGTPVNAPEAPLFSAAPPSRHYEHSYEPPTERFHKVANDDGAILLPVIGGTAYSMLECLRAHLNHETGQCNPSLGTIAEWCGVVVTTVKANFRYLYQANLATRVTRQVERKRGARPLRRT